MCYVAYGSLVEVLTERDTVERCPVETLCMGDRLLIADGQAVAKVVCTIHMRSKRGIEPLCNWFGLRAYSKQLVGIQPGSPVLSPIGEHAEAAWQHCKGFVGIVLSEPHAVVRIDGVACRVVSDYGSTFHRLCKSKGVA